jgi:hypothetical protein
LKNYILLILILLAACSKESSELKMAELMVEGNGTYLVTYGTSEPVTVKGEDKWSTSIEVSPGDTLQFSVKTAQSPVTLYLRVAVDEGMLFCRSLYLEPESTGSLYHILAP